VAATPARQFDTRKLSFGDMIAGASGLALLLFMFLPWFEAGTSNDEEQEQIEEAIDNNQIEADLSQNAWQALDFLDIILFLIAAAAIAYLVLRAIDSLPVLPVPPGLLIAALGGLALLIILFRIVVTPNLEVEFSGGVFGDESETVKIKDEDEGEVNRKIIGLLLSLLAAGGIAFGGLTSAKERAQGQFGGPGAGGPLSAGAGPGAGVGGPAAGGPITGAPGAGAPAAGGPAAGGPAAGGPAAGGGAAQAAGQPKADWYPDPKGEARLRYWDGTQWTDQTAE
jgi:Protein of unknown function (DUF2510)